MYLEGYSERQRTNLIGRVSAILRGLSKGDPFKGLFKSDNSNQDGASVASGLRSLLGTRGKDKKDTRTDSLTKKLTNKWLFKE